MDINNLETESKTMQIKQNENMNKNKSAIHTKEFLHLEDSDIYYEVSGEGPALIFVHGLGGNHLSWWQQIPHFSQNYTCINFSHRGFSHSTNKSGKFGHEIFASDLSALINHLNLHQVSLIAQSMGGWTSLTYALNEPDKVKSLVMASTSGTVDFRKIDHPELQNFENWSKQSEAEKELLKKLGVLNATGRRMAGEQNQLNYLYEQIYELTPSDYKDLIRADIRAARNLSPEILKNINFPVLYIAGEEDILFFAPAASALQSVTPNSKSKRVPNTGHSVYYERADVFNSIVGDFLSTIY